MRIAASVEFIGSSFSGWQKQINVNTIQGEIEKALFSLTNKKISLTAAGRTDAGVHALSQIIHFDVDIIRPMNSWVKGLNAHLPELIRIKWAAIVSDKFHARYSAKSREYQYLLLSQPIASAVWSGRCGWTFYDLNYNLLLSAANKFLGKHNFDAFRSSECQAKSPIRTIRTVKVEKFNSFFLFTFIGDGFLHHQIRNMMATIIKVGRGEMNLDYIDELFEKKNRHLVPATFSPNGLYLANIEYDESFNLPVHNNQLNIFKI
jgi:tRNA pseudouridine38-40 synthase|tara:strand:- start:535 stop:1320 length:786 start_codon:yes stop_codon:yes gene_type:complete